MYSILYDRHILQLLLLIHLHLLFTRPAHVAALVAPVSSRHRHRPAAYWATCNSAAAAAASNVAGNGGAEDCRANGNYLSWVLAGGWYINSRNTVDGCEILHHQKGGWNPIDNGINHLSIGAGFLPSTVSVNNSRNITEHIIIMMIFVVGHK